MKRRVREEIERGRGRGMYICIEFHLHRGNISFASVLVHIDMTSSPPHRHLFHFPLDTHLPPPCLHVDLTSLETSLEDHHRDITPGK